MGGCTEHIAAHISFEWHNGPVIADEYAAGIMVINDFFVQRINGGGGRLIAEVAVEREFRAPVWCQCEVAAGRNGNA